MDLAIKLVVIIAIFCSLLIWLNQRRKRIITEISPSTLAGEPILGCSIGNYFGGGPITITSCQLIIDNQISTVPVSQNIRLPQTIQSHEGIALHFDPIPLLAKAKELGQTDFKARILFQDSANGSYVSKELTIPTDAKLFTRLFEDVQEHKSEPLKTALNTAMEVAEQLDQQYVGIPHVVLGLVQEQNSVGGYVLRELGLDEDFVLNLAKNIPNSPRNNEFPQPHRLMETHELVNEYMRNEALKMRQKCFGTGHLLLGLSRQKSGAFTAILKHLEISSQQLNSLIYRTLNTNDFEIDHPTLLPEGIKRYIWAIWYQVAHTLLILFFRVIDWLFPDFEI